MRDNLHDLRGKIGRYERLKNSKADAYRCAADHWREKCISVESKLMIYSDLIKEHTDIETTKIEEIMGRAK